MWAAVSTERSSVMPGIATLCPLGSCFASGRTFRFVEFHKLFVMCNAEARSPTF